MNERIAVNPNIHFGKPCVAGTRITVQSVLELVREGLSFEEIIQDYYPELQTDHQELERVLKTYPEDELVKAFVVVEPGRHRFRKRPR